MIKYQYIQPCSYDVVLRPKLKDLCITIATDLEKLNDAVSLCHWIVSFKNPKDQFNKEAARQAISDNEARPYYGGCLELTNDYTRNEILSKILMLLCVHENRYTDSYRYYIRHLVTNNSFFDALDVD